jgi:hypothetical protein
MIMASKQELEQAAISVAALANRQFDYGQTFKIEWVATKAGLKMPYKHASMDVLPAMSSLGRFLGYFYQEMLKKHRKQVVCIHNWTLMVIRIDDQIPHNSERWVKLLKFANRKTRDGLTYIRTDRLDATQKRERSDALARIGALETFMERGYVFDRQQKQSPHAKAKKTIQRVNERLARQQEASQEFFIQD